MQDVECRGGWHDIQFGQSGFFGKGISIVIPRMPHWISYQNVGNEIKIELPMDWYEDNDFLGFALLFHLRTHLGMHLQCLMD